jgi:hypothetical protein
VKLSVNLSSPQHMKAVQGFLEFVRNFWDSKISGTSAFVYLVPFLESSSFFVCYSKI